MSLSPGVGRRILVIGVAGSGKTTLALQLGERLGVPVVHLDNVADAAGQADPTLLHAPPGEFPDHPFLPRSIAERRRMVAAIAGWPVWIAEGSFIEWTDALQDAADTIVWLDDARLRDSILTAARRAWRSRARAGRTRGAHGPVPGDSSRGSASRGTASRLGRARAIAHHAVELLLEFRDLAAYYWSRTPPGAAHDVLAGRWDRVTRAQVHARLRRHADRLIRIRRTAELEGLTERIATGPAGERRGPVEDQTPGSARAAAR